VEWKVFLLLFLQKKKSLAGFRSGPGGARFGLLVFYRMAGGRQKAKSQPWSAWVTSSM
jgi:hypothetical protein